MYKCDELCRGYFEELLNEMPDLRMLGAAGLAPGSSGSTIGLLLSEC